MKVYSASDITALLDIKESTLRKYCLMLEDKGYEFQKNKRNHRFFRDVDIISLRKFITLKDNGMSLGESAEGIVMWHKGNEEEVTDITLRDTDTYDGVERYNNDITDMKEIMRQQSEMINRLNDKVDKQQEYIEQLIKKKDEQLMLAINGSQASKKEFTTERKDEQKKKGFWQRLFNK